MNTKRLLVLWIGLLTLSGSAAAQEVIGLIERVNAAVVVVDTVERVRIDRRLQWRDLRSARARRVHTLTAMSVLRRQLGENLLAGPARGEHPLEESRI